MRERFDIDPAHTDVGFAIRHLVISKVRGSFTGVSGYILLDQRDMHESEVHAVVEMNSIDTNDDGRDEHLRSPDFFDVERFPEMRFDSTAVTVMDGQHFRVTGDLTLHGVTHPITLVATFGGRVKDPWGNERIGFEATTAIDRKEFGLEWNAALEGGGVLVGDTVNITIETEAVKVQTEAESHAAEQRQAAYST